MTKDFIDYGSLVDEAMYYVVRKALRLVQDFGLPSDHHFFVTFDTGHPGVMMSDDLKQRYPGEMTIVIQYQFWNLEVNEDNFSIVLSFDGAKQNLTIPFEALISFADPSVKFGLQFHYEQPEEDMSKEKQHELGDMEPAGDGGKKGDNVITLDSFRKK